MKNLLYILLFVPVALFGQENYSLSFDGVDDYVDITSSLNYPSNIGAISVSFKLDNAHISQTYDLPLFMINNGLSDPIVIRVGQCLCDAPGASLSFSNDDCGQSSPEVKAYWGNDKTYLYDGNWHNITLVVGDDYHEIYLDGRKLELIYTIGNESVGSFLYGAETDLFYFGKRDLDGFSSFFQGYMNNIQIWSTALSQTEIQFYMNCDPAGTEEGLVGYWNFNEGSGDTIYDISGNGNHGVIYGATYSEDVPESSCEYSILDQLNQSFDAWNVSIDLQEGWNMFGYGCPELIDVVEGLSNHTESIAIVKDNTGSVYIPEFSFDGIGNLTPGFGYQIKLTEAIEGFSLCDWYASDLVDGSVTNIENENIILNSNNSNLLDSLVITQSINTDLQQDIELTILQNNILLVLVQSLNQVLEENVLIQDSLINMHNANIVSLQDSIINMHTTNCIENGYCGFDSYNQICISPDEGFDCFGIELISYQVGDMTEGRIVFYIDETSQHGLVAAMEDIEGTYEWGCFGTSISGADGTSIGTGLQNTLDIVAQNCQTENGGITAAQATLNYETEGYTDWFLPSKDELLEMYNSILNQGEFEDSSYWSSSENYEDFAWVVLFYDGEMDYHNKSGQTRVRPIRSF